ncbi:MAG: energy-coupling factor ABC transporter ATP-binding protein [Candidatus Odinarchaeum yellowstonii]|uniref:Energy-coupling factor ABC transporter ATP-binding protein n=1 Tax=Odinarchaeota yellowstonii (strain LCB_4) TaxID=1841599 RepID=A0AAF0D146_ODILC|nr:MAG: energy-coupling factor ABC transporter ATP-binding protein [Candidatus Odinarchaeum yellowstonii]
MIEAINLSYTYPTGDTALRNISLKISDGELVAIMGPNGAGKSTLVKHFNGLLKPTRGEILVDGVSTSRLTVAELSRKVGFVFQNADHQLFAETVEKEIEFTLKNLGFHENLQELKIKALEEFDLLKYKDKSPFSLSGGERKRVALASVLCANPKTIILDEPTAGQDLVQKNNLLELIKRLHSQGRTVVIVSHDVEFIVDLNPRIITLVNGRILCDGGVNEVLTNKSILEYSSLTPPQITEFAWRISEELKPIPKNITTVDQLIEALKTHIIGGKL